LNLLRWIWFITFSRAIDGFVVLVALLFLPIFKRKYMGKYGTLADAHPRISETELISKGPFDPIRDRMFSDNSDNHNLMCQVGHGYFHKEIADMILDKAVTPVGSLYRKVPHLEKWGLDPSLDCLAAFCYFYVVADCKKKNVLSRLANHHWQTCFNLANHDGTMSGRCANGGLTLVGGNAWPKGKKILGITIPFGFTKPIIGQSYLTTAALLALAAHELGGKWVWRYKFWRFMAFGWFWEKNPWLPMSKYVFTYVGHVTQMALYVIHKCGHDMTKGLRWNAIDNAPLGAKGFQYQPFIAGMAADCGVLNHEEKNAALIWLRSRADAWPQVGVGRGYAHWDDNGPEGKQLWSMMAHCCVQLTGVKNE